MFMRYVIFITIILFIVTILVYSNVRNNNFISFDDIGYVCNNEHVATGINQNNVVWAFTSYYKCNWHPITWLSHMADVQIYGMNPRGHHLTNVVIHAITTLIIFIFLLRLTDSIWKSAFVAALFGLHPLHVESVAWVAERKDVLSAFFWFLTLLLYAEYVRGRKLKMYFSSIIIFVLGIMSKPMLVTLPFIMLLMDFWPLDRYGLCRETTRSEQWRDDFSLFQLFFKEKIPFFVFSIVSAVITIFAQYQGGAIKSIDFVPMWMRIANACTVYIKYISKMFWPSKLAVLYPLPNSIPLWQVICSLLVLVIITAGVIRAGRRHPYLAVGWFWFIITLAPVIGLIQVGSQSMADRYTYIPLTGLFIAITWGFTFLARNISCRKTIFTLLFTSIITILSILTWRQISYWKDSVTLYQHSLRVAPGSAVIHNNLGLAHAENGQIDMAISEYKKALDIYKNYTDAHYNLGLALAEKGHYDEAIEEYQKAILISPNFTMAHNNLGAAYANKGYLGAAIDEYRKSIEIDPYYPIAHYNLGLVLDEMNYLDEAISEFRKAIEINPNYIDAKNSLNNALEKRDKIIYNQ